MLILTASSNYVTPDFVRHLPQKPAQTKVTFIPTAAEVEKGDLQWLKDDRQALVEAGFPVSDFSLTGQTPSEVTNMLDQTDLLLVAGGNAFYLLQQMQKSGFAAVISNYVNQGLIYVGSSAGSMVAGPSLAMAKGLDDPELAPELKNHQALNLTDVVIFPHWGSPVFEKRYQHLMEFGYQTGHKQILLTDDQYLLVQDHHYTIESI